MVSLLGAPKPDPNAESYANLTNGADLIQSFNVIQCSYRKVVGEFGERA